MTLMAYLCICFCTSQDDPSIERLISALESPSPEERDRAQKSLIDRGEAILPHLKTSEVGASGETKARLASIIREIGLQLEERTLSREGLPPGLARQIPQFRERFTSLDETVVMGCLQDLFGVSKGAGEPSGNWIADSSSNFDPVELGALLRSLIKRAHGAPLKIAVLRLAGRHGPYGFGDDAARLLEDPDPGVQRSLLECAGRVAVTGAEEKYGHLLKDGTDTERELALRALERLGTSGARRAILSALEDPVPAHREQAIDALSRLGAEMSIPRIRKLLKDPEARVRYSALCALRDFRASDAWTEILGLEEDSDPTVRRGVLGLLGAWGDPRGKDVILRALQNPADEGLFEEAIAGAATLHIAEALPILLSLLRTGADLHAEQAAAAISTIGAGSRKQELLDLLQAPEAELRRRAILALPSDEPPRDLMARATGALTDGDARVRQSAISAICRVRQGEILPALRAALRNPTLRVDVLRAMVDSPQEGVGTLAVQYLEDPDPEVVGWALAVVHRHRVAEAIPTVEKMLGSRAGHIGQLAAQALFDLAGPRAFPSMLRELDEAGEAAQHVLWSYFEKDPDDALVEAAIKSFPRLPESSRSAAFRVITHWPSAASTAYLVKVMEDPHSDYRPAATAALLERGHPGAQKATLEEFRTLRGQRRLEAAYRLVLFCGEDESAIQALVEGIRDSDERIRGFLTLPLVARRRPEAKPFLLQGLRQVDGFFQELAPSIAHYPKGTFDADLRTLAAASERAARRGAARGLAFVDMTDRILILRRLLEDSDDSVRLEAVVSLGTTKAGSVPAELEARLADPSDDVRASAVRVIGQRDPSLLRNKGNTLLTDPSPLVREKAAEVTGRANLSVSPALLEKVLDDRCSPVRSEAARAIGALGLREGKEKLLWKVQNDPSAEVRLSAAHALVDLGLERGWEEMRRLAVHGDVLVIGDAFITLMEHADRRSVGAALDYIGRTSRENDDGNRALLALNAFTQPNLYRRCKDTKVDFRGLRGTLRERLAILAKAMGLSVSFDAAVPEVAMGSHWHDVIEADVADELVALGHLLDAAAVIESGRVRVMRRRDALTHWQRWSQEK